jgi:(R)-2-hydroxyacyl-CoA dehydratese activating ATPase
MAYIAGLDIGSAQSKAVIMEERRLISYSTRPTGGNFPKAAEAVMTEVLEKTGISFNDLEAIGGFGLGAAFIEYSFTKISDISCQSRGTHFLFPSIRTLIEVGNQASKILKVTEGGTVADCLVSDRCAAGSARVLQIVAKVLNVDLEEMGPLSVRSSKPTKFTTGCAVFLETEAISRVAEGMSKEDIIAGLHQTLASRLTAMSQRMRLQQDFAITGGGAKDTGLVKLMEEKTGHRLLVPEEPLITGAIGAAIIADERK